MDISGRTVLITGASSGIGAACAHHFNAVGCRLLLVARRLERLDRIRTDLASESGDSVLTAAVDVRDKRTFED